MSKHGFTLIELVLVVGLMLIIVTATGSVRSSWYLSGNFDITVSQIVSSLRKSQTYAIDNKSNATWGVCLTGGVVRLFSGSCLSPTVKNDFSLPSGVLVTGLSTVTFSKYRGEPSALTTINITSGSQSKDVSINLLGGMDIN